MSTPGRATPERPDRPPDRLESGAARVARAAQSRGALLIAGAVLLAALNLRTAIASVPPLLEEIRADVPLSAAAAGALTTLPVICMSLGSPLAPVVARRLGVEATLALMALTVGAGMLLRLVPGVAALYAGTTVAGLGIAVGNVIVPVVIKRDFPDRAGLMTGLYTMALSGSAAIAAALTVPVEEAIGGGWRAALAVWAAPALLAAMTWMPWIGYGAAAAQAARARPARSIRLWRNALAWQVTAFMGLQSLSFYSVLSWLPALLRSEGVDRETAGALLSLVMVTGIPTCLLVPVVAARTRDQRAAVGATVAVLAGGLAGLLIAPGVAPAVWAVMIGLAQGSLLALAFLFFALRSPDETHAGALAAMAQTVGYVIAAAGPFIFGLLREASDGWTAPLVFLLAVLVPLLSAGLGAGRSRQVG